MEVWGLEFEGARVGQFLGLGSRFLCGEGSVVVEVDATAVDMLKGMKDEEAAGRWDRNKADPAGL